MNKLFGFGHFRKFLIFAKPGEIWKLSQYLFFHFLKTATKFGQNFIKVEYNSQLEGNTCSTRMIFQNHF